jgi:solute carrier family 10 (sodium/bile acid cotransporter), member 7
MARIFPDKFIVILLAVIAVASVAPVRGQVLDHLSTLANIAIFTLFFFHGLRLSHHSVLQGVRHWRLQLGVMLCVFCIVPFLGLALWMVAGDWVDASVWVGIFFLCTLPSTVQAAISSTSIAGGNVAASVVAAALTNLAGVVLTPVLFSALGYLGGAFGGGGSGEFSAVGRIALLLLLPFVLGQIAHIWCSAWAERKRSVIALLDRTTIVITIYVTFCASVNDGLWQRLNLSELLLLSLLIILLMIAAFGCCWSLGRALKLERADRISLLFAGAHKSLATGAPMARILFPATQAGAIILPLMLYHQLQLILSSWMAVKFADQNMEGEVRTSVSGNSVEPGKPVEKVS